ncbi:MAG TPA: ISAs1 family transposase [Syntrophobacteraceae bacterium]|jgi:hypothetical protein|nr:ISAs1 family transposase [Syntrophobacteraceae bacterium]
MPKPQRLPTIDEQTVLEELQVRLVLPCERIRWNKLVSKHHYLKNALLVGEQLRYVVINAKGTWLALIGWSAAAMHLKARDQSIEWSERQREGRLHLLAQNSRFVILTPRQQFPNLASRAMSLCLKRLSEDWQRHYHHPIVMVESFVDRQYFQATAYKASGWQPLGYSAGFKRVAQDFYQRHDRPKELWVKELDRRAWGWLRAKQLPPPLARYEKSTPPACVAPTQQMPSLFERFNQVPDWRQRIGKRHGLPTVLSIIALACLSGVGQGYRSVSRFAKRLTKLQRRALRCWIHPDTAKSQVPSEAVFQRVLQLVPRRQIEAIAIEWQNDLLGPVPATDAVVIDGKEVRGANVILVNAIAQPSQRLLGGEAVDKKTNEIPTARTLIQRLDLKGKIVQLDGMHTQHQTVHQILYNQGADYSLILRDNQPTLLQTAQQLLPADLPPCMGEDSLSGRTQGVPSHRHPND